MKEFQEIISNKVSSMIEDGSIQKNIEDGIQASIERSISEMFGSYGPLTKQIEKGLTEGLQLNLKDMPFEAYNQQMLVAVQAKIGNMFKSEASQKFLSEIDKTLAPAPKEMSLVELVNSIAKIWREDGDDSSDIFEYANVEFSQDDRFSWYNLDMTKENHGYKSKVSLHISDNKIRINHSHGYNPTCFDEVETLIFKLYSAGTKITGLDDFDEDECELTLKVDQYY
jgi:hypothetical protein